MPIYVYRCEICGKEQELGHSIKDSPVINCSCQGKCNIVMGRNLIYMNGQPMMWSLRNGERGELHDSMSDALYEKGKTISWNDFKNEERKKGYMV